MKVVLDTNVLLSAATASRFGGGALFAIQQSLRRGAFELVLSESIVAELERNLAKPYFAVRLSEQVRERFVSALRAVAIMHPISTTVAGVATHPEDDLVLATAVDAHADLLVTGDKALQSLGEYRGVAIVSPARFAVLLADILVAPAA